MINARMLSVDGLWRGIDDDSDGAAATRSQSAPDGCPSASDAGAAARSEEELDRSGDWRRKVLTSWRKARRVGDGATRERHTDGATRERHTAGSPRQRHGHLPLCAANLAQPMLQALRQRIRFDGFSQVRGSAGMAAFAVAPRNASAAVRMACYPVVLHGNSARPHAAGGA